MATIWTTYKKWIIGGIALLIIGCIAVAALSAVIGRNPTAASTEEPAAVAGCVQSPFPTYEPPVGFYWIWSQDQCAWIPQAFPVTEIPAPLGPAADDSSCPTLQEIRNMTGLDWTRVGGPSTNENCTYNYNTADYSYQPMILLPGWMTSTAQADGLVHIRKGDGTTVNSKATTIRLLSANPGLTSELQTELTKKYAPSAGYDPSIVVCDDCSGTFSITPGSNTAPPSVPGFSCDPIQGGYVCKASTPTNFVVPSGWKAYAGIPPVWYDPGTDLGLQSQVSLYPSQ